MDTSTRIAEIERFIRFAHGEWPKVRPHVQGHLARRCSRSILSEKCVPLVDGVCETCLAYQRGDHGCETAPACDAQGMLHALAEILHAHEGRGSGNYDALVLFSGGKDSAYLLWRLAREFPQLRLLAATVDSGFFSSVAMANAQQILARIETVDHLVIKPRACLYEKTFRHAFTHLNEGGCYTTVDRMDGDLAFDFGRNLAASMSIPLVLAGLSPAQVERVLGLSWFETNRDVELKRRTHSAGFRLDEIYSPSELSYWWNGEAWSAERVPRVLYPFYGWGYDEDLIRAEVVRQGLIAPGKDNPLITNNDTIPVMLAVDVCFQGYSGFEPEFAKLVRQQRAERTMWLNLFESLEYLTLRGEFLPGCIADTLGRLQLEAQDVGIPPLARQAHGATGT